MSPFLPRHFFKPSTLLGVVATSFLLSSGIELKVNGEEKGQVSPAQAQPVQSELVTIESDSQQADNQTGIVTATGNVRITYPAKGMVATSKQAQYFSKEGRLVLSGDVDVIDAQGQKIRAERLVYQLDQERLLAQPAQGKQVMSKLKLNPQKEPGPPVP